MINLEDINEFFQKVFGDKVKITAQNQLETEKEQLQLIIDTIKNIIDRDYKLAEITNIDFTSYSEPYFIVIENLISIHYGDKATDAIMFYLYGNKDDEGNDLPFDEDENNNLIYIKTFEELWEFINKCF